MLLVELVYESEFAFVAGFGNAGGVVEVGDGFIARLEEDALVGGRHEAGAPAAVSIHGKAVAVFEDGKAGGDFGFLCPGRN